jgi:hypothetical protein
VDYTYLEARDSVADVAGSVPPVPPVRAATG